MKELISLWKNTDRHSAEVKALTVKHIAELKQKLPIYKKWLIFCRLLLMIAVATNEASCAILDHIEKGMGVS